MLWWIKRITVLTAGLLGLGLFAAWLLLSSPILAKIRGDVTARLLTRELGQEVAITGGVGVDLGAILHVTADGLLLPSQTMADVALAKIGQLEFDVALRDLLGGAINLSDLQITGAKVQLVVAGDGTSSWATTKSASDVETASARPKGKGANVFGFLAGHRVRFDESDLSYRDARNGLELDLLLTSFELSKKDSAAPVVVQGAGALNGQDLTLIGNFPPEQPFKLAASFGQIDLTLDGTPDQGGYDVGYSTAISIEVTALTQLLDVLKLEKSVSGIARASAVFKKSPEAVRIDDLDVLVSLDGGQSLILKGDLGKLGDPTDVTLDTIIRLYREGEKPAPTAMRRDLKLVGIDMKLMAQPGGIPQRAMVIETNGFVLDTSGEGPPPVTFGKVSRTPDGKLRIGKVELRIGPPEAPFVILDGSVGDALGLDVIDLTGTLNLPAASLVAPELFQASDVLGRVTGGFRLTGNTDALGLSDLSAVSDGTDLWNLTVTGSVKNTLKFEDVVLDVSADVPSGAALLKALDLKAIETGAVELSTKVTSHGTKWTAVGSVAVDESQLLITTDFDLDDPHPMVRGQVESDLIKVDEFRDIIAAALQLSKLNKKEKPQSPQDAPPAAATPTDDDGYEPLVLKKINPARLDTAPQPGPLRNVTLQPLGRAVLLSGLDLSIAIDLRKIEGDKGSSSLKSDVVMKDNQARFGPMKLKYGDAHFDISGSMDLNKAPDILKLSGSTGGWDFGEIMQDLHVKKQASGVLYANFDVSGHHTSVQDFLATLKGAATVSMRNGSIDSQLLDLAGLGVIPWLFSKDRGTAATIVCARAPLYISNGRISTKQTVVETSQVQIVVVGNVDMKHKTLDITGQPRRIGKPLSRSPWPFTMVGAMVKPKVKVKDGPRRLHRSDGATTMPKQRKLCVPDILQLK